MENQEERGRVRGRDREAGDRLKGVGGSKRQSKMNKEGKTEEANTKAAESSKRTFFARRKKEQTKWRCCRVPREKVGNKFSFSLHGLRSLISIMVKPTCVVFNSAVTWVQGSPHRLLTPTLGCNTQGVWRGTNYRIQACQSDVLPSTGTQSKVTKLRSWQLKPSVFTLTFRQTNLICFHATLAPHFFRSCLPTL